MDQTLARRVLATGLALGLLTELVLDGPAYGLNVVVVVAATLGAGWLLRRRGRAPDPLDAWLPVTALVLAAFVALRGDPFMAFLDTAGAFTFTGGSLVAFSGTPVTRRFASVIATMGTLALGAAFAGAIRVLALARPARVPGSVFLPRRVAPVVRGLVIGLPLAAIFAVLFASADPIFGRALADVLGWRIDFGDLGGRIVFALACAWFAAGALSIAAAGLPDVDRSSLGAAARSTAGIRSGLLGLTEALVVLVTIDLVIGAFVGLQIAYLFGGVDTLLAAGLTYSDYARRGFFELVAAACLAGAVVVALEAAVARRNRVYVGGLLVLIGLTAVVLVSAALRLRLYQDAYGWTELRLYVLVAIISLAAGLALMTVLALRDRMRWLGHGLAVIGVVALVGLNLLAPAAFVAARNVERVIDPSLVAPGGRAELDAGYLRVLPDDAVPVLVNALPALPESDRRTVLRLLLERRAEFARDPSFVGPAAWNLGRERARAALEGLDRLP